MEVIGDFIPEQPALAGAPRGSDGLDGAVDRALGLLRDATTMAVAESALFGMSAASDFAGRVEELSRLARLTNPSSARSCEDEGRMRALRAQGASSALMGIPERKVSGGRLA